MEKCILDKLSKNASPCGMSQNKLEQMKGLIFNYILIPQSSFSHDYGNVRFWVICMKKNGKS